MSARNLIIGWDGADLGVIEALGPEVLPHTFAAMARGEASHLRSLPPYATLPNWLSFLTATDPGVHGVFDFTERTGYRVRFRAGQQRAAPLWAERLDALGKRVALVNFPGTFPPPKLEHGVVISGWDAPVAFDRSARYCEPASLHRLIEARFGSYGFDESNAFRPVGSSWYQQLGATLSAKVDRHAAIGSWLLNSRHWDVFALYFGESDGASHHLWSLFDPRSPRRPPVVAPSDALAFRRVYEALDRALGQLLDAAGPGTTLTIVSDHGSGGSSDRVLYLNRALAAAGLLRFKQPSDSGASGAYASTARWAARGRSQALSLLPPRLRQRLFEAGDRTLPSRLESEVRFGAIDWQHTRAFSDELNYFPGIYLNVAGREPEGIVPEAERAAVLEEVRNALEALRDSDTGARLIARTTPREALFHGPQLHKAPDLILEPALLPPEHAARPGAVSGPLRRPQHQGYSVCFMPSATAPDALEGCVRRLAPSEWMGRKGRSLPGSHRPRGLYVSCGPEARRDAATDPSILDVARALLRSWGVDNDAPLSTGTSHTVSNTSGAGDNGHVVGTASPASAETDLQGEGPRTALEDNEALIEARLRALGYVG